jgi:hypothetical protein
MFNLKNMTMKPITLFALVCCIAACNNSKSSDTGNSSDPGKGGSTKEKILGTWTDSTSPNALFEIRKDSIYYVDQATSYPYILYRDTIKINYGDHVLTGLVVFNKDTMIVESEGENSKYWKFKK